LPPPPKEPEEEEKQGQPKPPETPEPVPQAKGLGHPGQARRFLDGAPFRGAYPQGGQGGVSPSKACVFQGDLELLSGEEGNRALLIV